MVTAMISTFAMDRGEIMDWQTFVDQNLWARTALELIPQVDEEPPKQCIAIFYVIDNDARIITHLLHAVTWSPEYKFRAAFRSLNWERFEGIYNLEEEDITQLENPQNIIKDGGEIFYLMHHDVIMGTVAVVVENCEYEVAWMSIGKDYLGFGFPHALLVVITNWARLRGLPGLSVLTSTSWGNAVSLYETHGFQVVHVGDQGSNARYDTALRLCL